VGARRADCNSRGTRHLLAEYAQFDEHEYSFHLTSNPFPGETIHPGPYRLGKNVEDANTYRVGHPLAQRILAKAKQLSCQSVNASRTARCVVEAAFEQARPF
jgi:hypothetical protein